MKDFIKRKLNEHWGWEDEPVVATPLQQELEQLSQEDLSMRGIEQTLMQLEEKYADQYGEYAGDSYGVIEAMKKVMPQNLKRLYDSMHPTISNEEVESRLSEKLKHKEYIKIAMNAGFETLEAAKKHLMNTLSKLNTLPPEMKLFRVVFVNDPKEIDTNAVGSHYVDNRGELERTHAQGSHVDGGQPYILTVKAAKSLLDKDATIRNKMQYPHENEITLKNKGIGAKIINVDSFKSNDDDLIGNAEDFEMNY